MSMSALSQFRLRFAGRSAKRARQPLIGHGEAHCVVEIFHVQLKGAVAFKSSNSRRMRSLVSYWVRRRGEPHELVFTGINPEASEISECGIEQPKGMGKMQFAEDFDPCPLPTPKLVVVHSPTPSTVRRPPR